MNIIDALGLASSIIITLMFIPEVMHVYKNSDAKAINYSFLHFQKKCKKYYKDRINFYKNPKNLISRQLFAKY